VDDRLADVKDCLIELVRGSFCDLGPKDVHMAVVESVFEGIVEGTIAVVEHHTRMGCDVIGPPLRLPCHHQPRTKRCPLPSLRECCE
jgi:hypothetical protein